MIVCDWALVTGPTSEPITLEDAKNHLHMHQDDDNALVNDYLRAARQAAENYLGRGLFTQTWKLNLSRFADVMWLPMAAPLASVTSVKYYDSSGTQQTLATTYYTVETVSTPGSVVRAPGQSWPAIHSDRLMPVEIIYVCGYADTALIPDDIKSGIRVYLSGLENGTLDVAKKAADAIWSNAGVVRWIPPQECLYVG